MTPKPIHITRDRLVSLLEAEVKRLSGGVTPLKVTNMKGWIKGGESFDIEGIVLEAAAPKPKDFSTYTPPAGRGKIKLAAVDGEMV